MKQIRKTALAIPSAVFILGACTISDKDESTAAVDSAALNAAAGTSLPAPGTMPPVDSAASTLKIEVDLAARRLSVLRSGDSTSVFPVAVGSERWPTQTGEWRITQVVWNPEWIPPDESWAEQREPRDPGDPRNPLGRVQLVYDPPRTIHGTSERSSIGKAVSHGSLRMYNEDAARLGRELMETAGVSKDSAFYRNVERNRTEKVIVDLPGGVPIRVF